MRNGRTLPGYDEYLLEEGGSLVAQKCSAKRFVSRSKGWRNGKRRIRKQEKDIILLKYGVTGWKYWDGGDHNHNGRIPFDDMATEIYGLDFCNSLPCHPDDYLRQDILDSLIIGGGKF